MAEKRYKKLQQKITKIANQAVGIFHTILDYHFTGMKMNNVEYYIVWQNATECDE